MSKQVWKLLDNDSTLDRLKYGIEWSYGGTEITLIETSPCVYVVANSDGAIEGVRVKLVRGRYRFEGILS